MSERISNAMESGVKVCAALLLCLMARDSIGAQSLGAQSPGESNAPVEDDADARAAWQEVINRQPARYTLFLDTDRLTLRPQPVLRWANFTRITEREAGTFVWTLNGRPEAVACAFTIDPTASKLIVDLQSLSRGRLVGERDGRRVWFPTQPGVEFRPLLGAPVPADSATARLRQMKRLARRFRVTMLGWLVTEGPDREELRMLPQPIYRYQSEDPNLLDGALFVFVQGTDPETLLIFEAVRTPSGLQWQYDLVRRTSGALEARYQDKIVWEAPRAPNPSDPKATRIEFRHTLR